MITTVFVLVLTIGGSTPPEYRQPMHFYSIERCNWFASRLTRRYANSRYYYWHDVPEEKRALAYCIPKQIVIGSGNPPVIYE